MDPKKITELANLLRQNGDKILNSEFNFTLSGSLLRALNDSFTLIADAVVIGPCQTFQVVKAINSKSSVFRDLQLIHDFVQKTVFLCIIQYPGDVDYFNGKIDITKFRSLKRLEVQKIDVKQIVGIQPLRAQIQQLICVKSLHTIDDIITHCGGDNANGFVWNELKIADFSYNQLQTIDTALEFAQYLQHLNLRHNQLITVEAIKWLPNLLTLDLSFNRLTRIPQFHLEACKRLVMLNMSNNYVEDLLGLSKLDVLTDLDLSDNCLLDHNCLLPLSTISTLKYLNLYGNPLHCHPKHRLATAQFLHKNIANAKFTLDFEPLSRSERAILGSQQMRRQLTTVPYNRFATSKSNAISVSSSISRSLNNSTQLTPTSSIGSRSSFRFEDNTSNPSAVPTNTALDGAVVKKRISKIRNVEIPECGDSTHSTDKTPKEDEYLSRNFNKKILETSTKSADTDDINNREHLRTKQHIKELREKYGSEWLQSENAQMMHNVSGIQINQQFSNASATKELHDKRQTLKEYLSEFPVSSNSNINLRSSTPIENVDELKQTNYSKSSASNQNDFSKESHSTGYMSIENIAASNTNSTLYKSANSNDFPSEVIERNSDNSNKSQSVDDLEGDIDDITKHLKNIYSSVEDEEPIVSEPEDDEETYIVYTSQPNASMFLTISSNFLKEKDTLTQKTKNKWSLKILESCDRIKSNTLRINFDTLKLDKQERIYTIEDGLCQELERKLRNILSQRDLNEMNQTIYRCVNCSSQFSRENKNKNLNNTTTIYCPCCKSKFVAEIHDIPRSLEKSTVGIKISPAIIALPVEKKVDLTANVPASSTTQINQNSSGFATEENNSIGSANSLNDSSISKISNSQNSASSGDSNKSVAGSPATERDIINFETNYESDVDVISNPSLSSIEVLEQMGQSRKTSEERRLQYAPNLETIEDYSYQPPLIETYNSKIGGNKSEVLVENDSTADSTSKLKQKPNKSGALAHHLNLTESSSSGSVTDSVCTAYDQLAADKTLTNIEPSEQKIVIENLLRSESAITNSVRSKNLMPTSDAAKKDDSSISSMFGALFQSTNILMSSSKKLLEAETGTKIQTGFVTPPTNNYQNMSNESNGSNSNNKVSPVKYLVNICTPYKFNYTDFNDVDHRLKLYFYQTKFEEGEHFKWLVRGRIYNTSTHALYPGIVVMSTCKCYVMELFAGENDDVTKWLRLHISFTVDRLEAIQLLPFKIGLSFRLRDWGSFLLLLQDILRTDSLLLYFANHGLPSQCELNYQISEQIIKRLNNAVVDEKLKMLSLLNGCEIKCENAKRAFALCGLLTTDTRLYLTSGNLSWLCSSQDIINTDGANDIELELCITQFMSNLVEVERPDANVFIINFLDETQDKCEQWKCTFETKENAESCFNSIGQSWEILFGVPLFTTAKET